MVLLVEVALQGEEGGKRRRGELSVRARRRERESGSVGAHEELKGAREAVGVPEIPAEEQVET